MDQSKFTSYRFPSAGRGPIEIVFGMPSEDCEKYGLCRIEFNDTPVRARCRSCEQRVSAHLSYTAQTERLVVEIPLDDIDEAIWDRQFSRGFFELVEPCPIPVEVANYLEIEGGSIVDTGRYGYSCTQAYLGMELRLLTERKANFMVNDPRLHSFPAPLDTVDRILEKYTR